MSIAHAEINAIRIASQRLNTHDLAGCTLYTSAEPCPMCLSAIIWSNIKTVYYGNTKEDAASIGFRDDFIYEYIDKLSKGIQDENVLKLENIDRNKTLEEFNKFNLNFIKDVKSNTDANVSSNGDMVKIILENGVNYTYVLNEKAIYRDKTKIAEKINVFSAQKTTINGKTVLKIRIGTGKENTDFGKTINYVLKYW